MAAARESRMSAEAFADHARRYSELGWALIRAEGKRAKARGWEKTQPEDPELAAGKWAHWGDMFNMGVVCGTSSVAILDVDVDENPEGALLGLLGMDVLPGRRSAAPDAAASRSSSPIRAAWRRRSATASSFASARTSASSRRAFTRRRAARIAG